MSISIGEDCSSSVRDTSLFRSRHIVALPLLFRVSDLFNGKQDIDQVHS